MAIHEQQQILVDGAEPETTYLLPIHEAVFQVAGEPMGVRHGSVEVVMLEVQ